MKFARFWCQFFLAGFFVIAIQQTSYAQDCEFFDVLGYEVTPAPCDGGLGSVLFFTNCSSPSLTSACTAWGNGGFEGSNNQISLPPGCYEIYVYVGGEFPMVDNFVTVNVCVGSDEIQASIDNVSNPAFCGSNTGSITFSANFVNSNLNQCDVTLVGESEPEKSSPQRIQANSFQYRVNNSGNWATFINSATINGLSPGTYDITVRNPGETNMTCWSTVSATISYPEPEIFLLGGTQNPSCGQSNGILQFGNLVPNGVTIEHRITELSSQWQLDNEFPDLPAGIYTCQVRYNGNNGCIAEEMYTLEDGSDDLSISLGASTIASCDLDDAEQVIIASGGSGNYQYRVDSRSPQTGSTIFNLGFGNHTYYVIDTESGCEVSVVGFINENPDIPIDFTATDASSCSAANGTLLVTEPNNDNSDYIFELSNNGPPQTDPLFQNLPPGSYTLYVETQNGECFNDVNFSIGPNTTDIIAITYAPDYCGQDDGGIIVSSPTGPDFVYSLDGITWQTSNEFPNRPAGAYIVYVQLENGSCANDKLITIPEGGPYDFVYEATAPAVCGGGGTLSVSNPQGAQYIYSLDGISYTGSPFWSPLVPGDYTVYIETLDGTCATTNSATVPDAPSPEIVVTNGTMSPTTCGSNDGVITFESTTFYNTQEYRILEVSPDWGTSNVFTGLIDGNYTLEFRADGNDNCIAELPYMLSPSFDLTVDVVVDIEPDCGAENGQVTLTTNGVGPEFEYSVDGMAGWQESPIFPNQAAGTRTYYVREIDAFDCGGQILFTLNDNGNTATLLANKTDVTSCGLNDGEIVVTSPSGPNYQFSINGGNWTYGNEFSGLSPGDYLLEAQLDNGSCTSSANYTIIEGSLPLVSIGPATQLPTNCASLDGTIAIDVSPPDGFIQTRIPEINLEWTVESVYENIPAGNYTLEARVDENDDCISFLPYTLDPAQALALSVINVVPSDCGASNGEVVLSTNSTGNFQYSDNDIDWQSSNAFIGQAGGFNEYFVRSADNFDCNASTSYFLPETNDLLIYEVDLIEPSECGQYDGEISITAGPGTYTYRLNSGVTTTSSTFFDIPGGTYLIEIFGESGNCTFTDFITMPPGPDYDIVGTVQNPQTCGGVGNITIDSPTGLAYRYSLNGGTPQTGNNFANLPPGEYTVEVTTVDVDCSVEQTFTIEEGDDLEPTFTVVDATTCGGSDGSITVEIGPSSDFEYQLDNEGWVATNAFPGLSAGNYQIGVRRDDGSCEDFTNVIVGEPTTLSVNGTTTPVSVCGASDGTITITEPTGNDFRYSLNGGTPQLEPDFEDVPEGQQIVTVTNINNDCSGSLTLNVSGGSPLTLSVENVTPSDCGAANGSVELITNTTGNLEYREGLNGDWQSSNAFFEQEGGIHDYFVRNADNVDCNASTSYFIPETNDLLIYEVDLIEPSECGQYDGEISITAGPGTYTYRLNSGVTTTSSTFFDIPGGTYLIEIFGESGNCTFTDFITMPSGPDYAVVGTVLNPQTCGGVGNITIDSPTGLAYRYSLNGGTPQTGNNFANLPPGEYTVEVTTIDVDCSVEQTFTIEEGDDLEPTFTVVDATTCGGSDGSITVEIGPGSDFEYQIDNGNWVTSNVFPDLSAGEYQIGVRRDDESCAVFNNVSVSEPATFSIVGNTSPVSVCGISDGTITITQPIGAEYRYSLNGGTPQVEPEFVNQPAGEQIITVTTTNGNCSASQTFTVGGGDELEPTFTVVDASSCGGSDGSITVEIGPGSDFEYQIDNGNWVTSNVFPDLSAGEYQIGVRRDDESCAVFNNVSVSEPATFSIVGNTSPVSVCGISDGTITITQPIGAEYRYSLNGGTPQVEPEFVNQPAGEQIITVTTTNGNCSASQTFTIGEGDDLEPTFTVVDATTCGGSDGSIIVEIGPGSDFEYQIDNGNWMTSNVFPGLSAGEYQIGVRRDDESCAVFNNVSVSEPATFSIVGNTSPVSVCGAANGTITITQPIGAEYRYSLNGGTPQVEPEFVNQPAGEQIITVTTTNGNCSASQTFTIGEGDDLEPGYEVTNVSVCGGANGSIAVVILPLEDYQYQIDGGMWVEDNFFDNLTAGEYQVGVRRDDESCAVFETISITEPASFTVNGSSSPVSVCGAADGTITITQPIGAEYRYSLNGGTPQVEPEFVNQPAGEQIITVTTTNGNCSASQTFTIGEGDDLEPTFTVVDATTCGGSDGSIIVEIGPGSDFEYQIDNGNWMTSNVFPGLSAGEYQIGVRRDDESCAVFNNVSVGEPATFSIVGNTSPVSVCGISDGTITITQPIGAEYRYSLNGGTPQVEPEFVNQPAGEQIITVTTTNGNCSASQTFTIGEGDDLEPGYEVTNVSVCGGANGSIAVVILPLEDYQYQIDGGMWVEDNFFENLTAGEYQVGVRRDDESCAVFETISITEPASFTVNGSSSPVSVCGAADGTITITQPIGAEYRYSLNGGTPQVEPEFVNQPAGDQIITVTTTNGNCSASQTFTIGEGDDLEPGYEVTNVSVCGGANGSIAVVILPLEDYQYQIDGGEWVEDNFFENLTAGEYQVGVRRDDESCAVFETISITEPASFTVNGSSSPVSVCGAADGTITITQPIGAEYRYSLNGGTPQVEPEFVNQPAGDQIITVTTINGVCSASQTFTIGEGDDLEPGYEVTNVSVCGGANGSIAVVILPLEDYQYQIDGGMWVEDNFFDNLTAGEYQIGVRRDDESCAVFETISITEPASFTVNGSSSPVSVCGAADGTITITQPIGAEYRYSLNGGTPQVEPEFVNQPAGEQIITVTTTNGNCSASQTFAIGEGDDLEPTFTVVDATTCGGSDGSIIVEIGPGSDFEYQLDNGNWMTSNVFPGLSAGEYQIGVRRDDESCAVFNNVSVGEPATFSIVGNTSPVSVCGISDGTITITQPIGAEYRYSLNGGTPQVEPEFVNQPAGEQIITVTTTNGNCSASQTFTIGEGDDLEPGYEVTNVSVCGGANGSIAVVILPLEDYQYQIDGGMWVEDNFFDNLTAGEYQIGVRREDESCAVFETISITEPASFTVNGSSSPVSVCGAADGTITITQPIGAEYRYSLNGGTPQVEPEFVNQPAGDQIITVTTINGVCSASQTFTIGEGDDLNPGYEVTNVSVCGGANGSIAVVILPLEDYQYQIDGGMWVEDNFFDNLTAGEYQIGVRREDESCAVFETISITEPASFTVNGNSSPVSVCGAADGTITITQPIGAEYSYSLNGGAPQADPEFQDVPEGEQIVEVSNGNCSATQSFTVGGGDELEPSFEVSDATTCGGMNGSIAVVLFPSEDFEYKFENQDWGAAFFFDNLTAGTYQIGVRRDDESCAIFNNVSVGEPATFSVTGGSTPVSICGADDGTITITNPIGSEYTYSLNGGAFQNSPDFENVPEGEQTVEVTNGNCTTSQEFTIGGGDDLVPSFEVSDATTCGGMNGSIAVVLLPSEDYEYQFENEDWDDDIFFDNLTAGEYQIGVRRNDESCAVFETITVLEPASFTVSGNAQPISFCGLSDGSITVESPTGAGFMYSYVGGGAPQGSPVFFNLAAGVYQVIVTDSNGGCESTESFTVDGAGSEPLMANSSPANNCVDTLGSISVQSPTGDQYRYRVNSGDWQFNPLFENLTGGDYAVEAQDTGSLCVSIAQVIVDSIGSTNAVAELPMIEVTNANTCLDLEGALTIINPAGSEDQYYSLNGLPYSGQLIYDDLMAGSYTLQAATTSTGCGTANETLEFEITTDESLELLPSGFNSPFSCTEANGSIQINTPYLEDADLLYSIDGGDEWSESSLFTGLTVGTYYVAARNSTATCEAQNENPIILTAPDAPAIQSVELTETANCDGNSGYVIIEALNPGNGTLEYSVNGIDWYASNEFLNLFAGTYVVSVRYDNGTCPVEWPTPLVVEEVEALALTEVTVSDYAGCDGSSGSIALATNLEGPNLIYSVDGGNSWSNISSFTELAEGDYSPMVGLLSESGDTCFASGDLISIAETPLPDVNVTALIVPSNCNDLGGELSFDIGFESDNFQYSIDNGQTWQDSSSFTGLGIGTYMVAVRDLETGCVWDDLQQVWLNTTDAVSINNLFTQQESDCGAQDGQLILNLNNTDTTTFDVSYDGGVSWTNETALYNLSSDTFNIIVRTTTGCTFEWYESIIFEAPHQPVMLDYAYTDVTDCGVDDGTFSVVFEDSTLNNVFELNGQDFYLASGPELTGIAAGTYDLILKNANGSCATVFPDEVTIENPFDAVIDSLLATDPSNCETSDAAIAIYPNGLGLEYSYNGGNSWVLNSDTSNLAAGVYNVGLRSAEYPNCATFETVELVTGFDELYNWSADFGTVTECSADAPVELTLQTPADQNYLYSIDGGQNWLNADALGSVASGSTVVLSVATEDLSCTLMAVDSFQVPSFDTLEVYVDTIIQPSCFDGADGQIWVSLNRDSSFMTELNWSNGEQSFEITNLTNGSYVVTATDSICSLQLTIELNQENDFDEILGQLVDTTECGADFAFYDYSDFNQEFSFDWSAASSGFTSQEALVILEETDVYYLGLTANNGCVYLDTLNVSVSDSVGTIADFLMPEQVVLGSTVRLIDITEGATDTSEWILDENSTQLVRIRDQSAFTIFTALGEVEVSLMVTVGDCQTTLTKIMEVVATVEELDVQPIAHAGGGFRNFTVFPNPTPDGKFWIEAEMNGPLPLSVQLLEPNGNDLQSQESAVSETHFIEMDLSGKPAGAYPLIIRSGQSYRYIYVINQ